MTTNCGSFKPEERASRVAAGIPMRVTAAAAMMVAQVRFATGIRELANAHMRTVANDPHVPGPGLRRPVPKNVATCVAQSGAPGRDAAATGGGTPAVWSGAAVRSGALLWLRFATSDCGSDLEESINV
jgi:hypothetical protein